MDIRKVEIDFSDAAVRWNPQQPEWCHIWNAMSTAVPALEQFLIKTVRKVRAELPDSAPQSLRRDVDDFITQEGRHTRLHMKFNKKLEEEGYDFAAAEKKLRADYARYLEKKSLRFSMVYCEGFETFGPIISNLFFDRSADMMKDWHEPSCHLWRWHIAEEYEHRHVCNYLYKEVWGSYRPGSTASGSPPSTSSATRSERLPVMRHDLRTGAIPGASAATSATPMPPGGSSGASSPT